MPRRQTHGSNLQGLCERGWDHKESVCPRPSQCERVSPQCPFSDYSVQIAIFLCFIWPIFHVVLLLVTSSFISFRLAVLLELTWRRLSRSFIASSINIEQCWAVYSSCCPLLCSCYAFFLGHTSLWHVTGGGSHKDVHDIWPHAARVWACWLRVIKWCIIVSPFVLRINSDPLILFVYSCSPDHQYIGLLSRANTHASTYTVNQFHLQELEVAPGGAETRT